MPDEDVIRAERIIETDFGEKVALDSPFEAKEFISALPWKEHQEEVEEHGSLANKLRSRDVDSTAIDAAEDFGFSDEFAAHATWDSSALSPERGAWLIDVDTFHEAADFFEFCGYRVEIPDNVEL